MTEPTHLDAADGAGPGERSVATEVPIPHVLGTGASCPATGFAERVRRDGGV